MTQQILISVIIPCYNNGRYLHTAINSILSQSYKHYEIIVVDDGSTDNTKEVAGSYSDVKYIYQSNQGPSAARNKGIEVSAGNYLVFLDADDWLVPDAMMTNLQYLQQSPDIAFVSGAHEIANELKNENFLVRMATNEEPYCQLLKKNYIGMLATVLFRKWAFKLYKFDIALRGCEDYDLYLKIARTHQVRIHREVIAVYRFHENNASRNYTMILESALFVLERQKNFLKSETEIQCYEKGIVAWKSYCTEMMYYNMLSLLKDGKRVNQKDMEALKQHHVQLYRVITSKRTFLFMNKPKKIFKAILRRVLPNSILRSVNISFTPKPGTVNLGDLNRTQPFSEHFGFDRGGPVDRYYIENFLQKNTGVIAGNVLEIGDNEYTLRYGETNVTKSDILHIDHSNEKATYVGDLSNAPHLPDNSFDCIILTQTLHLIYNYKAAVETCYRILKPGGTLLITVPGISHIAQDEWGKYWLWSFTDSSLTKVLYESFSPGKVTIETFGNVVVATAFLYGMGLPELNKKQLDTMDPHYQVIITAVAVK